ncbi:hypothetical protein [Streptomyces sp. NPDC004533]|uniref:hypothetical protein n=1 Tax=unclassified Streptomyces TaxID=2593676 RepID=UPI0033B5BF66
MPALVVQDGACGPEEDTAVALADSLADAVGTRGERSITGRLDTVERVLFALARAQGIDPENIG